MSVWSWSSMGSGAMMKPPPGRDSCRAAVCMIVSCKRHTLFVLAHEDLQHMIVKAARWR
jgi:hypothetical protein